MTTTLEVTPDGQIFVIDGMPEEPQLSDFAQYESPLGQLKLKEREYTNALASAPRILCADQEQAHMTIKDHYGLACHQGFNEIKPGIYSLPDVEWEKEERWKHGENSYMPITVEVAILKESPAYDVKLTDKDFKEWIGETGLNLNRVGELYEEGKDCLANCMPPFDERAQYHSRVYDILREMRDLAAVSLKESPKEESQVELWLEVSDTMDGHSRMHRIPILMNQFTITRKK